MAGAEIGLGHVEAGYDHMEDAYQASVKGGYRFQAGNAVFNATWEALHLARGDKLATWFPRLGTAAESGDGWTQYMTGLVGLERGRVGEAIEMARASNQISRDAGYQKMVWRTSVLLAHALAENMRPDEAAAVLPPLSSRVDSQDVIYDNAARVRSLLAAGDADGASSVAMTVAAERCGVGSPADTVAEAINDAAWLRAFIHDLPIKDEVAQSPRLASAKGRLALLEGRYDDAIQQLTAADEGFLAAGLALNAWHVGRALAEAEFRAGETTRAERRLKDVIAAADMAGAHLAAKLAGDTAARLGLDSVGRARPTDGAPAMPRVATGERMVSVLFADVRGYTEMASRTVPGDMAERIASLQRWATQEVERRRGIVDKFAGDAVMASFNVSGQSVDHTLQALRAAIAIIDKAALAELPVGAGISVGPAVVGNLAESANLSVLGEVTNLASRLQAQAAAGQVMLTEEVHRRVRDWLESQQLPAERVELAVKGVALPVVAFRVTTGARIGAPS
jgi:adenylate cyclase